MTLSAWIPFLEPLPVQGGLWWLLIIPRVLGICDTYKAVYCANMSRYWWQTLRMCAHVLLAMALLWAGLQVFVRLVIPALPVG